MVRSYAFGEFLTVSKVSEERKAQMNALYAFLLLLIVERTPPPVVH